MSTLSISQSPTTLVDRLFSRTVATDAIVIAAGAALVSIAAQIVVPIHPVPITGQTLAVLLVGASLGALRGALSLALYAVLGVAGLPVFANGTHGVGVLMSPTGGYIVGFVFAAALTGWLAQRAWDHRIVGGIVSFTAGTVVTFAFGLPWLAATLHLDLATTLSEGLYPFLIGGAVKALIAAGVIRLAWLGVDRSESDAR